MKYKKISEWCDISVSNKKAFLKFCNEITKAKRRNELTKEDLPIQLYEIAGLLYKPYKIKLEKYTDLELITDAVNQYFRSGVSKSSNFIDCLMVTCLTDYLENNVEEIEHNHFRRLPIDITDKVDVPVCSCGCKPKVFLKLSINVLIGEVICPKCLLKAYTLVNDTYDIETNINELLHEWTKLVNKNESIEYRVMKEVLKYNANCCVIIEKMDLHDKLWEYTRKSGLYEKYVGKTTDPEDRTICFDCCSLANVLLQIKETKELLDNYLWEVLPSRV